MQGLFIGKKVQAHQNVIFNIDVVGAPCDVLPPTGYGNKDAEPSLEIKSWPNPSKTVFNIKLISDDSQDSNVEIAVFDMSNKLVHSNTFNLNENYRFGYELQGGVYIVKLIHEGKVHSVRLIKYY